MINNKGEGKGRERNHGEVGFKDGEKNEQKERQRG